MVEGGAVIVSRWGSDRESKGDGGWKKCVLGGQLMIQQREKTFGSRTSRLESNTEEEHRKVEQ